jgi:hypothetical protein
MAKDKKKDKMQLVEKMMDLYEDKHNENDWNNNDAFDVACWFLGDMIMSIEADHLIPRDELQQRIKHNLNGWVGDVFQQIEENDH